jgi:hypothetical protein
MTTFKHIQSVQAVLDVIKNIAANERFVLTDTTNKSITAFTRSDDTDYSTLFYIVWLENDARLIASFNWRQASRAFGSDYVEFSPVVADSIEITVSHKEANELRDMILANVRTDWTKSGLEIPDVEIPEAA